MNAVITFYIVLFRSVNQTMWADKMLKEKGIPHKLVPVPRHISADCGVCLRIPPEHSEEARSFLAGIEGYVDIIPLKNTTLSLN